MIGRLIGGLTSLKEGGIEEVSKILGRGFLPVERWILLRTIGGKGLTPVN